MATEEVRRIAGNMLDGIKFNKDKFARDCITLCGAHDRLQAAFTALQNRTTEMELELKNRKGTSTPFSGSNDLPPGFGDLFSGAFGPK